MCARAEQKLSRRGERERDVCARALNRNCADSEREKEREMCVRVLGKQDLLLAWQYRRFSETKYGLGAKKVLKQSAMLLSW